MAASSAAAQPVFVDKQAACHVQACIYRMIMIMTIPGMLANARYVLLIKCTVRYSGGWDHAGDRQLGEMRGQMRCVLALHVSSQQMHLS